MCERHYEVEDTATGERFGNHTLAEAKTRAEAMRRNWGYKKNFVVKDRRIDALAAEVETLLREAGQRAAERYQARRQASRVTG